MSPHEYNRITWYGDEEVSNVWTAYTGTWSEDEDPNDPNALWNQGVMWSSLIKW